MNPVREAGLEAGMGSWMGAVIGTMALNLVLFAVIPNLMQPQDVPREFGEIIPQIQLTRIKREEIPPEKKRPAPKPKPVEQKPKPVKPRLNRPVRQPLTLPFEINPRLPGGAHTLEMPAVFTTLKHLNLNTFDPDGLFSPGDLDQPLTVLNRIPPLYPIGAKNRGLQGWVEVQFVVTELGSVENIQILSAEPKKVFDASVLQCVSSWRFSPGKIQGVPVKTLARTRIRFELN
ncbi:energy transducer TonB [Desulfospira joergensenii]|uniref:energy transducer TonB n=1 Tax=Desulfospira joergensenii TaxID=53329 RepID=UPI0003B6F740|nr:energy transducer TonB [Desulfospira joergensenii]